MGTESSANEHQVMGSATNLIGLDLAWTSYREAMS